MDSLKTLMDKKAYDLVLKLTEKSTDSFSLFYRISAYLALGEPLKSLEIINHYRYVLEEKPSILIKIHIEILCLLGRFDEAYQILKYYEELPYDSQETEEILRAMPKYIRDEERKTYRTHLLNEEELQKKLLSKDDEEVILAINEIREFPLERFLLPLLKIMRSHSRQIIRVFALLLLVDKKYDKEVEFLHFDKLIKVVPAKLDDPFHIQGYNDMQELIFALQSEYHNPSIADNAIQLISSYLLYIYPAKLDLSEEEIIAVFGYLSQKMLQIDGLSLSLICEKKNLDFDKLNDLILKIEEALKTF